MERLEKALMETETVLKEMAAVLRDGEVTAAETVEEDLKQTIKMDADATGPFCKNRWECLWMSSCPGIGKRSRRPGRSL